MCKFNNIGKNEMYTAGPVVRQLGASEVEMLLKNWLYKNYQVPIKFYQN